MKQIKGFAVGLVIQATLLLGGNHLYAAAQLSLSDGSTTVIVVDNGPDDANPGLGVITYNSFDGPLSPTWTFTATVGVTKPVGGSPAEPYMDIGSTSRSSQAGLLTIEFTDTDFIATGTGIASVGGTLPQSGGSITFNVWMDAANNPFAKTTPLTTIGPLGPPPAGTTNAPVEALAPYSLTLQTIINHVSAGQTHVDAEFFVIPRERGCECVISMTCPPPVTIPCSGDTSTNATGMPTITANADCQPFLITHSDSTAQGNCPGNYVITRTWIAIPNCGDPVTCTQTITVQDTTAPVISGVDGPKTNQCDEPLIFSSPTASDNCDLAPTLTFEDATIFPDNCPQNRIVIRTWTAYDACGNTNTASQTITVLDTVAPVISGVGGARTNQCGEPIVFSNPSASDNCDTNPVLTFADSPAPGNCPQNRAITRTWTAMDACGNLSTASQTITIVDTKAPEITCPADKTVECGQAWSFGTPGATDNCGQVQIAVISTTTNGTICNLTVVRIWEATDECGNKSRCSQTVTVKDTQQPAITSVPTGGDIGCNALPSNDDVKAQATASDDCSRVTITVTSTGSGSLCSSNRTYTINATDECGNVAPPRTVTYVRNCAPCVPATFDFSGNSALDGANGNVRTFTAGGISVKATAFSRTRTGGVWETAYLGSYGGGLGVTDNAEGDGSGNGHTVDNDTVRDNFVLFEFSQPVVLNRAFLGYVVDDSDISVWIGNFADPFNNHLTLSDAVLTSFGFTEDNLTDLTTTRWADLNAGEISGNAIVIAAQVSDVTPEDKFKIELLDVCKRQCEPLSLLCMSATTGTVGTPYSSTLAASGGTPPYTFAIISGTLPPGLSLNPNTGVISGTPTTPGAFNVTAQVTDSLGDTATTGGNGCSITVGERPCEEVCVPATFDFSGNSALTGSAGNVRTFTAGGISVKATAFSRARSNGAWSTAYLGSYGGGLGVTDNAEGDGSGNGHTVDNDTVRDNFVLFEFSQPVVLNRAFLGYVVDDSDVSVWIGNFADPFNNHLTLSDAVLTSFGFAEDNLTDLTTTRWADLNAGEISGNAIVIAAQVSDVTPEDKFKIELLDVCKRECEPPSCIGSICGYVLRDCDADGSLTGEAGLAGWTVKLKNSGGTVIATTTTGANGGYCFNNLAAGTHTVVVVPPASYAVTAPNGCNHQQTVNLASCQNKTGINFGYTGLAPSVNLVVTGPSSATCGQTITYTFTVKNTGNTCLYGGMRVEAALLGGQIFHQTPVNPGEEFTFTKTYVVPTGGANPLVLTATAIGDPPGGLANVTKQVSVSTAISCSTVPAPCLVTTPGCNQNSLSWNAITGASSYKIKRSTTKGGLYTVIKSGHTSTSYIDTGLVNGTVYYYVVVAVKSGAESGPSNEESAIPSNGLPSPWATKDIGSVGDNGGASYTSPKFTVVGSGADIWNTGDEFRYVYQVASGNCTIVARVASVQNTDPWAKAGVMIRETLTSGSKHASMFITPGSGAAFQSRTATAGASLNVNTTGITAPYWVKIVRSGTTGTIFTGYVSPNGAAPWTTIGSQTITMGSSVYIGLGVTSHNDGVLSTAVFDNVSATP